MKKFVSLLLTCMMLVSMTAALADKVSTDTHSYAVYATAAPEIDGVIDDMWAAAPEQWTYMEYTEDIGQAYGYTKIMWDESNLYFLGVVYDYTLDVSTEITPANGVNFWVSETNCPDSATFAQPGDWHIYANPFGNSGYYIGNVAAQEKAVIAATRYLDAEEPYYIVELKMPLLTPDLKLAEGAFIGYDVSVDDDADGDNVRDCFCSWSFLGYYWSDTAALANVQLVKEVPAAE